MYVILISELELKDSIDVQLWITPVFMISAYFLVAIYSLFEVCTLKYVIPL